MSFDLYSFENHTIFLRDVLSTIFGVGVFGNHNIIGKFHKTVLYDTIIWYIYICIITNMYFNHITVTNNSILYNLFLYQTSTER